jgi:hypothetical protein
VEDYCSQVLNVYKVSDVKQLKIYTGELLVLDPSPFHIEIAVAKMKRYRSPGSDQILAELIKAGCERYSQR